MMDIFRDLLTLLEIALLLGMGATVTGAVHGGIFIVAGMVYAVILTTFFLALLSKQQN